MRVVITGANRGIGLELVRQYLATGAEVEAGVRSPEDAKELNALVPGARGRLNVRRCDVTDDASVAAFAKVGGRGVDILVNNAGVSSAREALERLDYRDVLRSYDVNALGALRVTGALLPALRMRRGSLVACISSNLGSLTHNTAGGWYGYRMSKAALNMAVRSMAADLRADGVTVLAIHPGWVQTDMGGKGAPTPVEESVRGILEVLDRARPEHSGRFFDFRGEELPW